MWKNGDPVDQLVTSPMTIPGGNFLGVGTAQYQHTTGGGTSAGVINSRQLYYRLPEIQIHDVLDKDYRALLDYAPDAKSIDRTDQQTGTPFASATAQQKIDSVSTPLKLEDLSKPDQLKDLNLHRVYWNNETSIHSTQIIEPVQPYFRFNMSEAEWNELKPKTPGDAYAYVDSDIREGNLPYTFAIDLTNGKVRLRQELYRTYRERPSLLEIKKLSASEFGGHGVQSVFDEAEGAEGSDNADDVASEDVAGKAPEKIIRVYPWNDTYNQLTAENGTSYQEVFNYREPTPGPEPTQDYPAQQSPPCSQPTCPQPKA